MEQIIKSITTITLVLLVVFAVVGCNSPDDERVSTTLDGRVTTNERVAIDEQVSEIWLESDVSPLTTSNEQGVEIQPDDGEWALWLINALNPIPEGYEFELAPIGYSYMAIIIV
jgi:hypothetical protein